MKVHVEQLLAGSRARHGLKATFASEVSPKIPVNRSGAGAQAVRAWLEASPHHPRSARIFGYHPSPGGLTAPIIMVPDGIIMVPDGINALY